MKVENEEEKVNVITIEEKNLRKSLIRIASYTAYVTMLCSKGIIKCCDQGIKDINDEVEKIIEEIK